MGQQKKEMTKSHFNMWRLVVCAVHADKRVDQAELKMVERYLAELDFNEEQFNILKKELSQVAGVDEILPAVTDPGDRSQSVYFVRLLLWKDQILTEEEEAFLKKVQDFFAPFVNMGEIESTLQKFKKESENQDILPNTPLINLWRNISKMFQ